MRTRVIALLVVSLLCLISATAQEIIESASFVYDYYNEEATATVEPLRFVVK